MSRPSHWERHLVDRLAEPLRTFAPDQPHAMANLLPALHKVLGTDKVIGYSLVATDTGIDLSQLQVEGLAGAAAMADHMSATLRGSPGPWGLFNPLRPEPGQRNRVVDLPPPDLVAERSPTPGILSMRKLFVTMGINNSRQLRSLVCDGPVMLAWLGAIDPSAFEPWQSRVLRALVAPLRERLITERQLAAAATNEAALPAALEEIGAAAVLLRPSGAIVLANSAAQVELAHAGELWRARLRLALQTSGAEGGFRVARIENGAEAHYLAVARQPRRDPAEQLRRLTERWQLTERQAAVLALLVRGDANKGIGATLGCAENTVELHVTQLLHKAQVPSRAKLAALFWSEL